MSHTSQTFTVGYQGTTLASNVLIGATSISLASGAGFPATPFFAVVDQEVVEVTTMVGNNATVVTRGMLGTAPAAHTAPALFFGFPLTSVFQVPGRVVELDVEIIASGSGGGSGGAGAQSVDGGLGNGGNAAVRYRTWVPVTPGEYLLVLPGGGGLGGASSLAAGNVGQPGNASILSRPANMPGGTVNVAGTSSASILSGSGQPGISGGCAGGAYNGGSMVGSTNPPLSFFPPGGQGVGGNGGGGGSLWLGGVGGAVGAMGAPGTPGGNGFFGGGGGGGGGGTASGTPVFTTASGAGGNGGGGAVTIRWFE